MVRNGVVAKIYTTRSSAEKVFTKVPSLGQTEVGFPTYETHFSAAAQGEAPRH
jgi:hypothetical protein